MQVKKNHGSESEDEMRMIASEWLWLFEDLASVHL